MKVLFLLTTICFLTFSLQAQNFELRNKSKLKEVFTVEMMDSIQVKAEELRHNTETIYFEWSDFTTLVIFPRTNAIRKEGEQ